MKINLWPILDGRIVINGKVIDFLKFEIRDVLSPKFVKEKSLECCRKIIANPCFKEKAFQDAARITYKNLEERCQYVAFDANGHFLNGVPSCKSDLDLNEYAIKIPNDMGPKEAEHYTYHETFHLYLHQYKWIADDDSFEKVDSSLVTDAHRISKDIREGKKVKEFDFVAEIYNMIANNLKKHGSPDPRWSIEDILKEGYKRNVEEILVEKLVKYYSS